MVNHGLGASVVHAAGNCAGDAVSQLETGADHVRRVAADDCADQLLAQTSAARLSFNPRTNRTDQRLSQRIDFRHSRDQKLHSRKRQLRAFRRSESLVFQRQHWRGTLGGLVFSGGRFHRLVGDRVGHRRWRLADCGRRAYARCAGGVCVICNALFRADPGIGATLQHLSSDNGLIRTHFCLAGYCAGYAGRARCHRIATDYRPRQIRERGVWLQRWRNGAARD